MKRLGVFGGSFDPIHFGHIHLALTLSEKHRLDQVLFIPAAHNPLKKPDPTHTYHRLEMTKLAIEDIPQFQVDTIEIERSGPSFTVDTLRELSIRERGKSELFLLLGEDALHSLHQWKDPEQICFMAVPLILSRSQKYFPSLPELNPEIKKKLQEGWTAAPILEISATDIRNRLRVNLFCEHLVPSKVLDYIRHHRLYL
ncbi:MAG: nicotinate-nucleotide adenylyltransferase [Parachlamydiaceae bacterium]